MTTAHTKTLPLVRGPSTSPRPTGEVAVVDAADWETWAKFLTWRPEYSRCDGKTRAYTTGSDRQKWYLHRIIMQPPKGMDIDHLSGDTLDNRRTNLRVCTRSQNCMNRIAKRNGRSAFKGVHFLRYKTTNYIQAQIRVNGRLIHLGTFKTQEDAARAYDEAARTHFGEFARLNFPAKGEQPAENTRWWPR